MERALQKRQVRGNLVIVSDGNGVETRMYVSSGGIDYLERPIMAIITTNRSRPRFATANRPYPFVA